MQEIALFSGKTYTAGTNFTWLLVVVIATNLYSVREYILNTNGVSECKDPYCPSPPQSAGCRAPVGKKIKKTVSAISNLLNNIKFWIFTKLIRSSEALCITLLWKRRNWWSNAISKREPDDWQRAFIRIYQYVQYVHTINRKLDSHICILLTQRSCPRQHCRLTIWK